MEDTSYDILTDVVITFSREDDAVHALSPAEDGWSRLGEDLYLHSRQQTAYLQTQYRTPRDLSSSAEVVVDIAQQSLHLITAASGSSDVENGARLSGAFITVRRDKPQRLPKILKELRAKEDGTFKMLQISDTHMVAGVGKCTDSIDAGGKLIGPTQADPRPVDFIRSTIDVEEPDLVVFTGEQFHYGTLDTQSALLKLLAPVVEQSIPHAVVFGNHDDEEQFTLSHVDGVGNYYLNIRPFGSSKTPTSIIYFVDSHGEEPNGIRNPDYIPVSQSQIDWFTKTFRDLRQRRQEAGSDKRPHLSMIFMHIPVPEYVDDSKLVMTSGKRREPMEGPSVNSHFYDTLVEAGVRAVACGHDHVNDFGALCRPEGSDSKVGLWFCYGGFAGFGSYGTYGEHRCNWRKRVWELDPETGKLSTWKRVEYADKLVDEVLLAEGGVARSPPVFNRKNWESKV